MFAEVFCPSSGSCAPLLLALLLVGDFLVFILMALEARLLSKRRLTPLIWFSPILYGYVIFALVLGFVLLASGGLYAQPVLLIESLSSWVLGALVGAGLGLFIGNRMQIGHDPEGHPWFLGGPWLVAILWILLAPRALASGIDLLGEASPTLGSWASSYLPLFSLDVASGSLFMAVALLSITWRIRIRERLGARPAAH